ncbi:hypothetical protein ACR6C2_27330 [Streptomyces sp. INA 01156]
MPLRPDALADAVRSAPDLAAHDPWVRVDMHDYRLTPGPVRLRRVRRGLGRLDDVLAASRAGTELLLSTRWARPRPAVRRSRCSGCRCSWRTGTPRSRRWRGAASSSATSTIRPWTTTRERSSRTVARARGRSLVRAARAAGGSAAGTGGRRGAGTVRGTAGRAARGTGRTGDGGGSGGTGDGGGTGRVSGTGGVGAARGGTAGDTVRGLGPPRD